MKTLFTLLWVLCLSGLAALSLAPNLILTPDGSDKMLHVTSYCVLMLYAVLFSKRAVHIILAALLIFIFGVCMEGLQEVIGGRVRSVSDAMANSAGIVLGIFAGYLMKSGWNAKPAL